VILNGFSASGALLKNLGLISLNHFFVSTMQPRSFNSGLLSTSDRLFTSASTFGHDQRVERWTTLIQWYKGWEKATTSSEAEVTGDIRYLQGFVSRSVSILIDNQLCDGAVEYIRTSYHLTEEASDQLVSAGECYVRLEQNEKAVTLFERALALGHFRDKGQEGVAYYYLGMLLFASEEHKDLALRYLSEARELLEQDPSSYPQELSNVYRRVGLAAKHKGDYETALSAFRKVVEYAPADGWSYYELGRLVFWATSDAEATEENFRLALSHVSDPAALRLQMCAFFAVEEIDAQDQALVQSCNSMNR
jgi:tetratricopeptide (TPR) repeat protein